MDFEFNVEYDMQDFQSDCYLFNKLAGKDSQTSHKDLTEQFKLIVEELKETCNGLATNNPEEVLDGTIDVMVTAIGLLQKLEHLGMDVNKALYKTAQNNLTKFPLTEAVAIETAEMYERQGIDVVVKYDSKYDVYVIKDANDKVRKPSDFISNDLKDCIPEKLQTSFRDWKPFDYKLELVHE